MVVAHGRCTGIDPETGTEMYASVANAMVCRRLGEKNSVTHLVRLSEPESISTNDGVGVRGK